MVLVVVLVIVIDLRLHEQRAKIEDEAGLGRGLCRCTNRRLSHDRLSRQSWRKPTPPSFNQFQRNPAGNGFDNLHRTAGRESIAGNQMPAAVITSAQFIAQSATPRDLCDPPIVGPYEMEKGG